MQFSLLNSSDIKMVPQYCSYGSTGVPAVPATIFMSAQTYTDTRLSIHTNTDTDTVNFNQWNIYQYMQCIGKSYHII